jgi:hypothetical protein
MGFDTPADAIPRNPACQGVGDSAAGAFSLSCEL